MQIDKKCIETLFVNIMLKKNVLKNMDLEKTPFHTSLFGNGLNQIYIDLVSNCPSDDHNLIYKSNIGGVCLCGQCLEDSSSHCPFLRNNSFEHTEQGILNCFSFWPPGVCLHWGGSPKPRHRIFKDMIFRM